MNDVFVNCENVSSLSQFNKILHTKNQIGTGRIGTQNASPLKTLLGDPQIGNYVETRIIKLTNVPNDSLYEITAFCFFGTNVRKGYVYYNDQTWVWTGWK